MVIIKKKTVLNVNWCLKMIENYLFNLPHRVSLSLNNLIWKKNWKEGFKHGIYIRSYLEIGTHVRSNICYLICFRHFIRSRVVKNYNIYIYKYNLNSFIKEDIWFFRVVKSFRLQPLEKNAIKQICLIKLFNEKKIFLFCAENNVFPSTLCFFNIKIIFYSSE